MNNDQCPDLYFVEYGGALNDRLLINTKTNGVCTGVFNDETDARMCPNGPPCFNVSGFGTGVRIIDINKDGFNDIVKADDNPEDNPSTLDGTVLILYNDAANPGNFIVKHNLAEEFPTDYSASVPPGESDEGIGQAYMFAAGDMNGDNGIDLYVVRSAWGQNRDDKFLLNECLDPVTTPTKCNRPDPDAGTVSLLAPQGVVNGGASRTNYPGGNAIMADLDGDSFADVLLCDVDVQGSFFGNTLRLLQTAVDPLDSMNVTLATPVCPMAETAHGTPILPMTLPCWT